MKHRIAYLLMLALPCAAMADIQEVSAADDAMREWLTTLASDWASRPAPQDRSNAPAKGGAYIIRSIEELDAPAEVTAQLRAQTVSQSSRRVSIAAHQIPTVSSLRAQLPGNVLSDEVLRQRLSLPPVDVSATPLQAAMLKEAALLMQIAEGFKE